MIFDEYSSFFWLDPKEPKGQACKNNLLIGKRKFDMSDKERYLRE